MSQPTNHWKLGLFVTFGALAAVSLLAWVGANRMTRDSVVSYYFFDEVVEGLEVGSPIKFRGVPIGKVIEIRVAPDQRHVEVLGAVFNDAMERIGLERRTKRPEEGPFVPPELRIQLVTNYVTNTSFLQSDFFDPDAYPVPEYPFPVPWNTVHSVPSTGTSLFVTFEQLAEKLPAILDELHGTLEALHASVEGIDAPGLAEKLGAAVEHLDRLLLELTEHPVLDETMATLTAAQGSLAELEELIRAWRAEANVGETTASVRDLADRLGLAADELAVLGRDARGELRGLGPTLEALRRLAETLERDPGSLLRGRDPRPVPGLDR